MCYVPRFMAVDRLWCVGVWFPDGTWHGFVEFDSCDDACAFINYLNGGEGIEQGTKLAKEPGNVQA